MTLSSFGAAAIAIALRVSPPDARAGLSAASDEAPDPYSTRAKTLGVRAYLSGAAPKEEAADCAGMRVEPRGTVFAN